jgi:hypothetical protein
MKCKAIYTLGWLAHHPFFLLTRPAICVWLGVLGTKESAMSQIKKKDRKKFVDIFMEIIRLEGGYCNRVAVAQIVDIVDGMIARAVTEAKAASAPVPTQRLVYHDALIRASTEFMNQ